MQEIVIDGLISELAALCLTTQFKKRFGESGMCSLFSNLYIFII